MPSLEITIILYVALVLKVIPTPSYFSIVKIALIRERPPLVNKTKCTDADFLNKKVNLRLTYHHLKIQALV